MEYIVREIDGRICRIWKNGGDGPVIYWGIAAGQEEQANEVARLLAGQAKQAHWTLAAFEAENWNGEYSPWALPSVKGPNEFSGGARKLLGWLTDTCIPAVEQDKTAVCRMIGGYSLSGLFSLFAFYETGMFGGAASCSGSLWYPGWKQYAQRERAPLDSCVYLSLGQKEEKTGNRRMSAVGDMTRWQYEWIRQDEGVRACELAWHSGGHFTQVSRRIAQAFVWLLAHAPCMEEG